VHPAPRHVAHRPWPLPDAPWRWCQRWHDLAFLHWRVDAAELDPLIPPDLTLDRHDGSAWIAVAPFWMSHVTRRGIPAMPGMSRFPELNVRTYVRLGERAGVWFFSLDAANRLAVWVARRTFHLPYVHARMRVRRSGARVDYVSRRADGDTFAASYAPDGPIRAAVPGSLEHFLVERYCLFVQSPDGRLHTADIHHAPWPLQTAQVSIVRNDMLDATGVAVAGAPLVHFARRLDVVIWPLRAVN
jgi:uncharacterized protein